MKNNLQKGFIVPVLIGVIALLMVGGGVYIYKNKKVEAPVVVNENKEGDIINEEVKNKENPIAQNKNTKTFKLENLEFSYPDVLVLNKEGEKMILSHSIYQKHQNRCDFVGDKPMLDKIDDIGLYFEIFDKNLSDSIKKIFPSDDVIAQKLLKGNTITLDPGFIDKYKIGNLDGYKITRGFEGCGGYYYFFPISPSKTLSIYRIWSSQTVGQTDDSYMLKLPGVISFDKEEQIFKDILSSVTGLEQKETMSVKVYFGDTIDAQSCHTPSYVERIIPKTTAVARASIEELLKGPTATEKSQGRWTGLNTGISIKTLTINNGIAYIDFSLPVNSQFNSQNSVNTCKTSATLIITNQIESTLKQFSTVKSVVITVNGEAMKNFFDI